MKERIVMLAAVLLLTLAGRTPAPESTFGSTAVVQLEADAPQPVVAEAEPPLIVGPPPESLIVLASGGELFTQPVSESKARLTSEQVIEIYSKNEKEISKIWVALGEDATMKDAVQKWLSQKNAAEPPPGLLPEKFTQPKPVPVKKAAPVAAGQWVTRYAGFRGRRSYAEWVPAAGSTSANCANGQCAAPSYFRSSGCASCR